MAVRRKQNGKARIKLSDIFLFFCENFDNSEHIKPVGEIPIIKYIRKYRVLCVENLTVSVLIIYRQLL